MDVMLRNLWTWIIWCLLVFPSGCVAVLTPWVHLGMSSTAGISIKKSGVCASVGLEGAQQELCLSVKEGAEKAILECQKQFEYERWNCSTGQNISVFGSVLRRGTRETAFFYGVVSAGIVHSVTQACSMGLLADCTCDTSRYGEHMVEGWKWGGCSDNIVYGIDFSKQLVDAPETMVQTTKNVMQKMNLHNNEVGRSTVRDQMKPKCRCHGVSGSCSIQTCWKSLPGFHDVGSELKRKYENSVRIARRSKRKLRRLDKRKRRVPVTYDTLVFVHRSPNYCRPNPKRGILGTKGRLCNKTERGTKSCDLLCCGRGYNTQVIKHVERCHCRFLWCCEVKCRTCETLIEKYTCK